MKRGNKLLNTHAQPKDAKKGCKKKITKKVQKEGAKKKTAKRG